MTQSIKQELFFKFTYASFLLDIYQSGIDVEQQINIGLGKVAK